VSIPDKVRSAFDAHCDTIETAYEFFLAYASQGLPSDQGSTSGSQVREYLTRCETALNELGSTATALVESAGFDPEPYRGLIEIIVQDASKANAVIRVVQAQPAISSQLVDNLNASIHLRALLTDLFLIDEALKVKRTPV
jgi:hypothetical protein